MDNKQNHKKTQKYQRFDQTQMQNLVNFQVKEQDPQDNYHRKTKAQSNNSYLENSKRQKMYMKSKFQFVTLLENKKDEKCDYIQWDDIVQVIFPTTTEIICPICMNDDKQMVAPQITTCGHIYCLPCFLRHALISKTREHCPFCGEIAIKEDLKSIKIIQLTPTKKGQIITLSEVYKLKQSPLIYSAQTRNETKEFSRIIHVNKSYIQKEVINEEVVQLDQFLFESQSSQELESIPQIQEAISIVKMKEKMLKQTKQEEPQIFLQHLDGHFLKDENHYYSIYQESQGLLEYLHPICNKYMSRSFTSSEMPLKIESNIIEIDSVTLTEQNKQRYKFLSHLPVYTEVKFLEVEMFYILKRSDYDDFYDEIIEYRDRQKDLIYDGKRKNSKQLRKNSKPTNNQTHYQPGNDLGEFNENDFFPDLPSDKLVEKEKTVEIKIEQQQKPVEKKQEKKVEDEYPLLSEPTQKSEIQQIDNSQQIDNQQQVVNNYWDQDDLQKKQTIQYVKSKVTKNRKQEKEIIQEPQEIQEIHELQFQEIVKKNGKKKKVFLIPSGFNFG